jgi:hypothetical protein
LACGSKGAWLDQSASVPAAVTAVVTATTSTTLHSDTTQRTPCVC